MNFKIDRFVLAIVVVILIAYFFPQFGINEEQIPLNLISSIGISLIFFFYGLKLSPQQVKQGISNWKLHILIQLSTFVLFPLLIVPLKLFVTSDYLNQLWLALLFLAAVPSTVSSSVVMVSIARGNIPGAIFNASISGLIGIVVTPLWIGLFLTKSATEFDLSTIYTKLLLEIFAPIVVGSLLQPYFGKIARNNSKYLTLFDKTVILIIIYKSFAHSFTGKIFNAVELSHLLVLAVLVFTLFFVVYYGIGILAKALKFSLADQITAQFCGSKKSLVHGTVFAKILFTGAAPIGIVLLPLMLFHAFQIFVVSIFASQYAKR